MQRLAEPGDRGQHAAGAQAPSSLSTANGAVGRWSAVATMSSRYTIAPRRRTGSPVLFQLFVYLAALEPATSRPTRSGRSDHDQRMESAQQQPHLFGRTSASRGLRQIDQHRISTPRPGSRLRTVANIAQRFGITTTVVTTQAWRWAARSAAHRNDPSLCRRWPKGRGGCPLRNQRVTTSKGELLLPARG